MPSQEHLDGLLDARRGSLAPCHATPRKEASRKGRESEASAQDTLPAEARLRTSNRVPREPERERSEGRTSMREVSLSPPTPSLPLSRPPLPILSFPVHSAIRSRAVEDQVTTRTIAARSDGPHPFLPLPHPHKAVRACTKPQRGPRKKAPTPTLSLPMHARRTTHCALARPPQPFLSLPSSLAVPGVRAPCSGPTRAGW